MAVVIAILIYKNKTDDIFNNRTVGKVAMLSICKELSQNQCMLLQQENGMVTFKRIDRHQRS
jgi:hypothetical protein